MRGIKSEDLLAIVDFLYYGEAKIYQENLDTFLSIAEELQLKGLNKIEGGEEEEDGENSKRQNSYLPVPSTGEKGKNDTFQTKITTQNNAFTSQTNSEDQISFSAAVAVPKHEFSGDLKEIDDTVKSLMSKGINMIRMGAKQMSTTYVCNICGKEGLKHHIKDHIEANHLEGIPICCNFCKKTSRTRKGLGLHMSRYHKNN